MKFSTSAIHVGSEPNLEKGGSGDVVTPIHISSTFARAEVDKPTGGYEYSRQGNPTRYALEKALAALEHAKFARAYSSGLSATTNLLLYLKKGDHVISIDDVYGGTRRLFTKVFERFGLEFTFANFTTGDEIKDLFKPHTKMVWIESPTNPLMKIVDIASVAKTAKQHKALTVIDNTFASPYNQKPLDLGADIVLHSLTKYIGGHSNLIGGAVMLNDEKIAQQLYFLQYWVGGMLSPFDSFLVHTGLKTLEVRMQQHEENAEAVIAYLQKQSQVKKIYYPGLPTHPGYAIAKKQMKGFGGMLSFELDSTLEQSVKFLQSLKIIAIAESLGGVESLIEHPASMTHASVPKEIREEIGLADGLIRLSVGIEDKEDLIADLSQALKKISTV